MSKWPEDDEPCACSACSNDDCPRWASGFRWGGLVGVLAGAFLGASLVWLQHNH